MNSNITTVNSNQLPATIDTRASLIDIRRDAKTYPRLHTYPHDIAVVSMQKIVAQAFMYKGQAIDAVNVQAIATALVDELLNDDNRIGSRFITFAEIHRAIKHAVLNTDVYGISVASLYRIIADYIRGEGNRIEHELRDRREQERREEMKRSIIAPMLQSYAGQMLKNK